MPGEAASVLSFVLFCHFGSPIFSSANTLHSFSSQTLRPDLMSIWIYFAVLSAIPSMAAEKKIRILCQKSVYYSKNALSDRITYEGTISIMNVKKGKRFVILQNEKTLPVQCWVVMPNGPQVISPRKIYHSLAKNK